MAITHAAWTNTLCMLHLQCGKVLKSLTHQAQSKHRASIEQANLQANHKQTQAQSKPRSSPEQAQSNHRAIKSSSKPYAKTTQHTTRVWDRWEVMIEIQSSPLICPPLLAGATNPELQANPKQTQHNTPQECGTDERWWLNVNRHLSFVPHS